MAAPFPFELLGPPDPLTLPLPAAERPAEGVRLLRGVPYHIPAGQRPLELDVWLPAEAAGPLPVVVYVHGGAWRGGHRSDMGPLVRDLEPFARLARAGFAVVCPDYRLSGEEVFPAQLDDLARLTPWLAARSAELGTDPARTVLWGASAGGHLAALAALGATGAFGDPAPEVLGCVVWYGPADLTALADDFPPGRFDPADPATFEALLLGAAPADVPALARAASPALRVTGGAPPFLVLHGADDSLVPVEQGRRLAAALRAQGVPVDFREIPGADHLWVGLTAEATADCFDASLAFVRSVTSGAAPTA
ncbi:alpha/beta hydrolase [uncultured Streptomyces sp.]|uniref:alpha/beta hydrolase n=1 Tax=uncultured Streptomyces sp. TaxID=174707 RepID=UPI00261025FE|nr:alpha/beta hydrolase [uncultured Streptomyces sp.]